MVGEPDIGRTFQLASDMIYIDDFLISFQNSFDPEDSGRLLFALFHFSVLFPGAPFGRSSFELR